jgi:hypothetical protein
MSKYSPSFPYCNAMLMESVLRRKFIVIFSHAKCIKCIWINYIILLKYYIYSPYNYELILKKKQHQSFWPPTPPPPYPLGDIKQKMLYVCISMEPALILQKLQYRFFSLIHTCMASWKVDVIHHAPQGTISYLEYNPGLPL